VYGRPKHIYSIWRKMQKKSLAFDELFDVRAVRIVAERLQDCYGALGIVHTLYRHLPAEFDDYVANPKPNGYQSIHTVVLGPKGKTVEIQIRTRQMHEDAELGVAAHWKYKEGPSTGSARGASGHEERIAWLRRLIAWQEEMADSGEMLEEVRSQVFDDRVYVFTPKGDVVDLPAGSTPLDFAYHIHSDIGHRCIGAKIGGRIVPFTYQLQMGDQVEVITQKQPNPSRDWLNPNLGYITTSRGRAKIHNWFRKQDRDKNIAAGRQILDSELNQLDISLREAEKLLLPRYNVTSLDELLAAIGGGDIRLNQMVNFLQAKLNKPSAEEEDREALRQLTQKSYSPPSRKESGRVVVEGVGNLMHHIARCCQPSPGDDIVGFITQGRGISIHRADCDQLAELISHAPERIVDAVWGESYSSGYSLVVRVTANDRSGLLRDITTILANEKVNVLGVSSRSDTRKQLATIDMDIEIYNQQVLGRVLSRLNQVPDIIDARRLH
jgi:GTP pyrophosphokinase